MSAIVASASQNIDVMRDEAVRELPLARRMFYDAAVSENTTQAWQRYLSTMADILPGLKVQEKKDPYGNLPVINFTIGPGLVVNTTVTPAAVDAHAADVEDAVVKELPADPLELLPQASQADAEILATLNAAASAMALPDDD